MNANVTDKHKTTNRYLVTVSFYMHEQDDKSVIREATHLTRKMQQQQDNGATVVSISERKFGKLEGRKIM